MKNKIINYVKNLDLKRQLGYIIVFSLLISLISLIIILPNLLTPFYEKNIYELLNQPLSFIESNTDSSSNNIAFIVKNSTGTYISSNFEDYFNTKKVNLILKIVRGNQGKFIIGNRTYYYSMDTSDDEKIVTLTDDSYIKSQRRMLNLIIFPVVAITIFIETSLLAIWGNTLVNRISKVKDKVDNLDNKDYDHKFKFKLKDEVDSLNNSVEYMRKEINSKEEYKNNMFQNLSHELKTPISVISSYVEAANDKVITETEALKTIEDEIKVLANDVNMILELNKLNFLKDNNEYKDEVVDITELLKDLTEKYKMQRRDVDWGLDIQDENVRRGTYDIWKVIIDNIYGNFVVYADKIVKVTVTKNKITFYNDGEKIDEKLIKDIFTQYKKGIKGKFGLGLSIVKQSLELYGYKIKVSNQEKGVLFEIL